MNKEILDLCIGLDVGTSTTKVVVHPLYGDDSYFVVNFGEYGIEEESYLLPTRLVLNKSKNIFELPLSNGSNRTIEPLLVALLEKFKPKYSNNPKKGDIKILISDLKIKFMKKEADSVGYFRVFIALVIKYVKAWFVKKYYNSDFLKDKEIMWYVNMGVPAAEYSFYNEKNRYLQLLEEAVNLSEKTQISVFNYKSIDKREPSMECCVTAEIVAAVSSFVNQADIVSEGLYCAIDIGAATTDVCTFRVNRDELLRHKYSFLRSSVKEFGAEIYKTKENKLQLKKDFRAQLADVIWNTKQTRDPYAKEWKTSLPMILCGGGAYIKEYKDIIDLYISDLKTMLKNEGFSGKLPIILPHTTYISSDEIDPNRLIVAHGLCAEMRTIFEEDNCRIEQEIEDIKPIINRLEREEITKDMC